MKGWIFDVYPKDKSIVLWLKDEKGNTFMLRDELKHPVFVSAGSKEELRNVLNDEEIIKSVSSFDFVRKYVNPSDSERKEVLELDINDSSMTYSVARRVESLSSYGTYRLYNVDIPPAQYYLYSKDLFPLAYCKVNSSRPCFELLDDVWSCNYTLPEFKCISLEVIPERNVKLASENDRLVEVLIDFNGERIRISSSSEEKIITELSSTVNELDPDFIFTEHGDRFVFPYLVKRARKLSIENELTLGREREQVKLPSKKGTSFFSYGRILYKPSPVRLLGRIHIDLSNSFVYDESGFDGLFEISRICRLPLHTASRASIGKALSSLESYIACKRDLLVPWKPSTAENFKSRLELLNADRGGLILEPKKGLFENVGELDFSSLYPSIMMKKNISAETVKCSCCPESRNIVPELGWNVCEKKRGIVPEAIEIIIKKRELYKELRKRSSSIVYERRQIALKWLGVTSFGYLGFSNAKFGKIDAHIAVCAWDREILKNAMRIAEENNFSIIHGIVDSLWLYKKDANEEDYIKLKNEIEQETGFRITFEGIYKWIAFLSSKVERGLAVINRYFGVYRDGRLKVRGIEARRNDVPKLIRDFQLDILSFLSNAENLDEVRRLIPYCNEILKKYEQKIRNHEVRIDDLVFSRTLSKKPSEYKKSTILLDAAMILCRNGLELNAGDSIDYIVVDGDASYSSRAVPVELINEKLWYDESYYIKVLRESFNTILEPFNLIKPNNTLLQSEMKPRSAVVSY